MTDDAQVATSTRVMASSPDAVMRPAMQVLRHLLAVVLAVLLLLTLSPAVALAATDDVIEGVFLSPDYETETDVAAFYRYSDAYFDTPASTFDARLADMSLCLTMSTMPSAKTDLTTYADADRNVVALLDETGFTDVESHELDSVPTAGSLGFVIASKQVTGADGPYTLVAVSVRGEGYGMEWLSNIAAGTFGDHEGFSIAAAKLVDAIDAYVQSHVTGDAKLWLCGYSRGAAVANLAAARLDAQESSPFVDIYAYLFATPKTTVDTEAGAAFYDNIHNTVLPADLITSIPPSGSDWDFTRYGTDHLLPDATDADYAQKRDEMLAQLAAISPNAQYLVDDFMAKKLDGSGSLADDPDSVVKTQSEYATSLTSFLETYLTRKSYATTSTDNPSPQDALTYLMSLYYGATPTQKTKLMDSVTTLAKPYIDGGDYTGLLVNLNKLVKQAVEAAGIAADEDTLDKSTTSVQLTVMGLAFTEYFQGLPNIGTLVGNFSSIYNAHSYQTYLAFLRAEGGAFVEPQAPSATQAAGYRQLALDLPTDGGTLSVTVTDAETGETIATLSNATLLSRADETIHAREVDGKVVVWLPLGASYDVTIAGATGTTVTPTIREYSYQASAWTRSVTLDPVEMREGRTLMVSMPAVSAGAVEAGSDVAYTEAATDPEPEPTPITPGGTPDTADPTALASILTLVALATLSLSSALRLGKEAR